MSDIFPQHLEENLKSKPSLWHPSEGYPPRPYYQHPHAEVDFTAKIGAGCKIWANAGILAMCELGRDVSIGRGAEIGRGSTVGDSTRIGWGCFFPPNSTIGKDVFVGPGTICTDDRHPKVPKPWEKPYDAKPPVIGDGAAIGAACVILPGIHIGRGARIAAGSIVTKDVPDYAAVRGGPARFFDPPKEWDPRAADETNEGQYQARISAM